MKKITLFLFALTFLSCSSDDGAQQSTSNTNGFSLNNSWISTGNGYLARYDETDHSNKNYIILTNGSVTSNPFDVDTIQDNHYGSATTNLVYLTINSTAHGELVPGTYTLDTTQYSADGYFYWANIITGLTLNADTTLNDFSYESTSSSGSTHPIVSGRITIAREDENYAITYTLNQSGETIQGNYYGPLTQLLAFE